MSGRSRVVMLVVMLAAVMAFPGYYLSKQVSHAATTATIDYPDSSLTGGTALLAGPTSYHGIMCEKSSDYCVDSPDLLPGTYVYEKPWPSARSISFVTDNKDFCVNGHCYWSGLLELNGQPGWCLAQYEWWTNNISIEPCTGEAGVTWGEGYHNGGIVFVNRRRSLDAGKIKVFSGKASNGYDYSLLDYKTTGAYQRFQFCTRSYCVQT